MILRREKLNLIVPIVYPLNGLDTSSILRMMLEGAALHKAVLFNHLHKNSMRNADVLARSSALGCFYCLEWFGFDEIQEWVHEEPTALCPKCGIDSVLGDAQIELTDILLEEMRDVYFGS